jgi:L-alanine-DL-glutamate epimerase-like enolase superfamily enzyme
MKAEITKIECTEFLYPREDVYSDNEITEQLLTGVRIETDVGTTGEFVGLNSSVVSQVRRFGDYLVGRNPFHREKHWNAIKSKLGKTDRASQGPVDIALWDFAGKYYDAPIHELLGTHRERLPAYASLAYPDNNGGMDSPEAVADFAEEIRDRGYHGCKLFGWNDDRTDVQREIKAIHAVGERVGDDIDLMYDAVCNTQTWTNAWKIGKALDEEGFLWYEDPYADGGFSQHGHQLLRDQLDTPMHLSGEIQRLEQKVDFMVSGGTDFARASMAGDGGITGAMKVARAAEGLGMDIEFHYTGPYARHCGAAVRNTNFYELGQLHPDVDVCFKDIPKVYQGGYSDDIDAIDQDGYVSVPDDPGIGVDFDWSFIEENAVETVVYT